MPANNINLERFESFTASSQVRDYLLRQKACFEFVHLAQQMELRRWKTCLRQLEGVKDRLINESERAALRMDCLAHPDLAVNPRQNPIITSKDGAFSRYVCETHIQVIAVGFFTKKKKKINCLPIFFRLLQILERDPDKGRSEPFRTYESLGQVARKLAGDLQTTRDALAGAAREQRYSAARLSGDCEALHRAMYTELQQLNLGPQVCPLGTTDQELLCPNAQVGFFLCTLQPSTSESNLEEINNVSWISLFFFKRLCHFW